MYGGSDRGQVFFFRGQLFFPSRLGWQGRQRARDWILWLNRYDVSETPKAHPAGAARRDCKPGGTARRVQGRAERGVVDPCLPSTVLRPRSCRRADRRDERSSILLVGSQRVKKGEKGDFFAMLHRARKIFGLRTRYKRSPDLLPTCSICREGIKIACREDFSRL